MLSRMTNCISEAQACLPPSTLQRHLKRFQPSTWFGKLWGFLWDPSSFFLGHTSEDRLGWRTRQGRFC